MILDLPGLHFDPSDHLYTYGQRRLTSVSGWLRRFKRPFDEIAMSERVAQRDGKTPEQVRAEWKAKRDASTDRGKRVHAYGEEAVERHRLGDLGPAPEDPHELALWRFLRRRPSLEILAVEQPIAWPEAGLAGTPDMLGRYSDRVWVFDWKTNEEIRTDNPPWRMLGPFRDMPDHNGSHYAIQLAAYRVMLEAQYGLRTAGGVLVHLTPEGPVCPRVKDATRRVRWVLEQEIKA